MWKKISNLSLKQKRAVYGYLWISPFLIGFILFIFRPIIQSLIFSFSELSITNTGFELDFVGLDNFLYALFTDANFIRELTETSLRVLLEIPVIIIFSFFAASILNQKFKGRLLARIIFFLPIILGAGVIYEIEQGDFMHQAMEYGEEMQDIGFFGAAEIMELLQQLKLPTALIDFIIQTANKIPLIIRKSAIPILIFLAGLQSIPASLFEAAKIEGATSWESFWKITFPLVSPLFLTNIVFIIIDSFTTRDNALVELIEETAWGKTIFGVSVAMTWIYFLIIGAILTLSILIISKKVVYMD